MRHLHYAQISKKVAIIQVNMPLKNVIMETLCRVPQNQERQKQTETTDKVLWYIYIIYT